MKKNNKLKHILLFVGIFILIITAVIGYLVVRDLKQEDILKQEIVNIGNKNLLTDNYEIEVKTTGDYAYIEEAIKKYFKELSDNVKLINGYLNNEDLIYILSADNLKNDGPKFEKSYKLLKDTKDNINKSLQTIIDLCNEEAIKNLIDKEKVDDYSYDLYLNLMYTKKDLEKLEKDKEEIKTTGDNLIIFLDKVEEMINILAKNSDNWYIEDGQLYFETDNLVNQYNNLYKEINSFVAEKFPKQNTSKENTQNKV